MTSNNTLTFNRYFRLMGLASVEVIATVPLGIWVLVVNCTQPIYVWRGLGDLHFDFSRVDQVPAFLWLSDKTATQGFEFDCWMTVIMPLIFFGFFGVADEARRNYKLALSSVAKRVGISTTWLDSRMGSKGSKMGSSNFGKVTIPSFVQRGPRRQHQSVGSFTDKLSVNISIDDVVAYDGSIKEPKAAYSPSEHSGSSGSSTYIISPTDEKANKNLGSEIEVVSSEPQAYTIDLERNAPDVPSSVPSHTVDMA